MNINKADTIRNPYALARWLVQTHGGDFGNYLAAIKDRKNQQGIKQILLLVQKALI